MKVLTLNRLLSDPDFIELDISLKKYNVFRSLKIQEYEIRHSKFLGHLLNPNETHGLGAEFLTNFLLCLSNSTGKDLDISELDLDLTEVTMEWSSSKKGGSETNVSDDKNKRLDLLLRIPQRYERQSYFDIAVEMKWRAKQHKGQLVAYTKQLDGDGIAPKISILLTANGEEPESESQETWQGVTYQDVVVPALKNTLQKQIDSTSPKVINTLEDWLDILDDETSEESSQKSAVDVHCDKLLGYKEVLQTNSAFLSVKYPSAFEKLKSHIKEHEDTRGRVLKYFEKICEGNFVSAYSNRTYLRFYPSKVYPFAQDIGGFPSAREGFAYPLIWEILVWEADKKIKLRLVLTLAKLDEKFTTEQRKDIADKVRLKFGSPKWGYTNGIITDNWTRIIRSEWEVVENSVDEITVRVDSLIKEAKATSDELERVLKDTCLFPLNFD